MMCPPVKNLSHIISRSEDTDTTKSISAQASESFHHYAWNLCGVEECAEKRVVVHSSQGQPVEWNGLKLYIHEGSLPEGLQQCTIYIKVSLAGEYEIPENSSLVSAIFWLRCEPECTFAKPVTVEIQHCSTKQDISRLKIVRAFCSQKKLPYTFKSLGGRFNADTSYGSMEVKGFSGFGVIEESPASERLYYNQLFYRSHFTHQQRSELDIHIIYTWNTKAHINHICKKYPEQQGFHAGCYQVVELDGDVIKVGLEKEKWTKVMDGQWEIHPKKPIVTKLELDAFKPRRSGAIPYCMLVAHPLCENFPYFLYVIKLSGIEPPYNELTLSCMPFGRDRANDALQQPQALAIGQQSQGCLGPNDLQKVQNRIWEARVQWYNLGLGLEITPDSLDAIELANMHEMPDRCFRAMLTQWLRKHHKPTWSALAEALKSPSVGLGHLAEEILEQNCCTRT